MASPVTPNYAQNEDKEGWWDAPEEWFMDDDPDGLANDPHFQCTVTAPMCIRIGYVHQTVPLFRQQEAPLQSQFTELHLRAESVI